MVEGGEVLLLEDSRIALVGETHDGCGHQDQSRALSRGPSTRPLSRESCSVELIEDEFLDLLRLTLRDGG